MSRSQTVLFDLIGLEYDIFSPCVKRTVTVRPAAGVFFLVLSTNRIGCIQKTNVEDGSRFRPSVSSVALHDFPFPDTEGDYGEGDEDYDEGEGDEYEEGDDYDAERKRWLVVGRSALGRHRESSARGGGAASSASPALPPPPSGGPSIRTSHITAADASLSSSTRRRCRNPDDEGYSDFSSTNPLVHSTLTASLVPIADSANILDVFNRCISSGTITKQLAKSMSDILLSLAKSDALFASLRNSDAPAIQLDKRVAIDQPDLPHQIREAVRVVSHALSSTSSSTVPLDPSLISSIQLQLHQVFLFAVTSSPRASQGRTNALQELAGLVQMLGVLSGIHIGSNPAMPPQTHPGPWNLHPHPPSAPPDIGTAVYPCLVPSCSKTFHRLYSLRAHQRIHTLVDRPYRCTLCPASFVRNHDLKRHAKLHDTKAWRCAGCGKVFSRRDAIKRHKDSRGRSGGKGRSGDGDGSENACAYADVEEVEVEKAHGEEEASRRAKLWNGIAASQMAGAANALHMGTEGPEDGEVDPAIIEQAQTTVLQLHGLLQAHVAKGLGTPTSQQPPNVSQATLASIIARVQQSSSPQAAGSDGLNVPPASTSFTANPEPEMPSSAAPSVDASSSALSVPTPTSLSLSWLSDEQTKLLEQAISQAASAALAQAEAEAALEEEGEGFDDEDDDEGLEDD
ncbi:Transcriptional factor SWI5 [Grifola frondosa]|uniref:Transcriptional factor SWI5 n=1 Tax=Grifola frondosa TaxID=5627 RepID=A0A1C7MD35_GRIFR|nr:Transcriptional factor SWI5 [Grifola frondosa]